MTNARRNLRFVLAGCALALAGWVCGGTPSPQSPPTAPPPLPPGEGPEFRTFGDSKSDQAWAVEVDEEGRLYFASHQQEPGELFTDMVIYRLETDGSVVWETRWGGPFQEKAFILAVEVGTVYVGGTQYNSAGLEDADEFVVAFEAGSGAVLWEYVSGGTGYEEIDGLVVDGDDLYITGWTDGGEGINMDVSLRRLKRENGELDWAQSWGMESYDHQDGQIFVDDAFIYLSGLVNGVNFFTGGDAVIAKFSKETGEYVAFQTWGGAFFDDGLGMTGDGQFLYVTGLTLSKGNGGQIFLLKYDKDLNLIWEQVWGGAKGESARTALAAPDGNVIVVGHTFSEGAGGKDIVALKYTPEGELLWSRTWGEEGDEDAFGAAIFGDLLYIAGQTNSFGAGEGDALLLWMNWRYLETSP